MRQWYLFLADATLVVHASIRISLQEFVRLRREDEVALG